MSSGKYTYGQVVIVPHRSLAAWLLSAALFNPAYAFARVCNASSPYAVCEFTRGGGWFGRSRQYTAEQLDEFGNQQPEVIAACEAFAGGLPGDVS